MPQIEAASYYAKHTARISSINDIVPGLRSAFIHSTEARPGGCYVEIDV